MLTAHPAVYKCPADGQPATPGRYTTLGRTVEYGLGSYAGSGGTDGWGEHWPRSDGILYYRSRVTVAGVRDGTSSTLLVGE